MDIFAEIVLSLDGEDIFIKVAKESITVTTSSVSSGLRALISIDEHHELLLKLNVLNKYFLIIGWAVYARIGIFNMAILGLKGRPQFIRTLLFFGRIGRMVGAV